MRMSLEKKRIVVRKKNVPQRKKYTLTEMLAKVTPENLHSEVDLGPPVGREEW